MNSKFGVSAVCALALAAGACSRPAASGYQGYLEGEFVHVGSQLGGRLEQLAVRRGDTVEAGKVLFTIERTSEQAARNQVGQQLQAQQARIEDLRKGSRPSELAALESRLRQSRAAAELSKIDLDRQETLFRSAVSPANDLDRARINHQRNLDAIEEVGSQIATARLGARPDALVAAEAELAATRAAAEQADWALGEKNRAAPVAGRVFDTLFRPGEIVPPGGPVVVLLPPENIKVRFFIPEADLAGLKMGDRVMVALTGRPQPLEARVNYVSPRPEFTPPVLYNRENRSKLVFLVEAAVDPAAARELHPGQPATVTR